MVHCNQTPGYLLLNYARIKSVGASTDQVIRLSVFLSLYLSICSTYIFCASNQTWYAIAYTSLTSHTPGGGAGSKCRFCQLCFVLLLPPGGIPVSQTHLYTITLTIWILPVCKHPILHGYEVLVFCEPLWYQGSSYLRRVGRSHFSLQQG